VLRSTSRHINPRYLTLLGLVLVAHGLLWLLLLFDLRGIAWRVDGPTSDRFLKSVLNLLRGPLVLDGSKAPCHRLGLQLSHSGVRALHVDLDLEVEASAIAGDALTVKATELVGVSGTLNDIRAVELVVGDCIDPILDAQ
jgi:hypothetical protein